MDTGLDHLRVLPHSSQSEQAVLGGLMLSPGSLWRVKGLLEAKDFYRQDHQLIFRAIEELAERKQPFDAVTLSDWFEAQGQLQMVGEGAYLTELATTTPSAANILGYAKIVQDKAFARAMIAAGTGIVDAGFDRGLDRDEALAAAQQAVQDLMPRQQGGLVDVGDTLPGWFEDLRRRHELGTDVTGTETPWDALNRATHGLQDGELIIVAGRPSMGKSIIGLNLVDHVAEAGGHVALFSLEMTKTQINRRGISARMKVPHAWLMAPSNDDDYWSKVTEGVKLRQRLPISVDDTADLTIAQLAARARALHMRKPIRLLVVDHIHDFKINAKEARFEYGRICQVLKALAKEFGCPVVALAQLNRQAASRTDHRPNMSDLRESGEIEQKADLIVFVHREDYYNPDTHLKGIVELIIAKGRDIEAGISVHLRNDYGHMAARNLDGELPQAPEPDTDPAAPVSGRRYFGVSAPGGRRKAA